MAITLMTEVSNGQNTVAQSGQAQTGAHQRLRGGVVIKRSNLTIVSPHGTMMVAVD